MSNLRYRLSLLRTLNPYAKGRRLYFIALSSLSVLSVFLSFILPFFYRIFVDDIIIARKLGKMIIVVVGYIACNLLAMLITYLKNYSENVLQRWTLYRIKHRLLNIFLGIPLAVLPQRNTGDLKMRIDDDAEKLSDFCNIQTIEFAKACITSMIAAIMLLCIEWRLAFFSIFAVPLTFFLDNVISTQEKKLVSINRRNADGWQSWLITSIQGWKTIKSLNLQKNQMRVFVSYAHNYALFFGRWINYWVMRTLVVPKVKDDFLMRFVVYFFGGLLIMHGGMTIGTLLMFVIYFDIMSKSIKTASTCNAELRGNSPYYDRVLDELKSGTEQIPGMVVPYGNDGHISVQNISFRYDDKQRIFSRFSAEIRKGEWVAIVGKSGVGKTTLLKLIMGMLVPDEGQILFNGEKVSTIDKRYLYGKIGCIMQENILFNLSIRENLRFASPSADQSAVEEACKMACIHDFICSLHDGYDTIIGERGIKLSGGQKQRIVLARLLLRNVGIIIFDEATSALDQQTEMTIYDTLRSLGREKTIIIVAHRQSSISLCDKEIVLS